MILYPGKAEKKEIGNGIPAAETVQVADKALQIYSGYGYMRYYPLERMYRDARIVPIYEGTSEVQKMIIAREAMK